jgi:hypothetical protein
MHMELYRWEQGSQHETAGGVPKRRRDYTSYNASDYEVKLQSTLQMY